MLFKKGISALHSCDTICKDITSQETCAWLMVLEVPACVHLERGTGLVLGPSIMALMVVGQSCSPHSGLDAERPHITQGPVPNSHSGANPSVDEGRPS